MKEFSEDRLREILREARGDVPMELKHDLWPRMLELIERPRFRIAWFDWALAAASVAAFAVFPEIIPALLMQL